MAEDLQMYIQKKGNFTDQGHFPQKFAMKMIYVML